MRNFVFYNPTRIVFGKDRLAELDSLVPANAVVLLIHGRRSARESGTLEKVSRALGSRRIVSFEGIGPNPIYSTLMRAVEVVKTSAVDFILAVGGGSVIDAAKFVALASGYEGKNTEDLLGYDSRPVPVERAPAIGAVVTMPASGSEMNSGCIISHDGGKFPVFSPLAFPRFSILDPTLTYGLPKIQVANGVVDAFVHTVEQYVTVPAEVRLQDRTAEGILRTLVEIGRRTIDDPTDYDARANLMWCATTALNGSLGVGVPQDWTTHKIGHELTALFDIDHAQTLAVLLPSVWTVLREQKQAKLVQFGRRVWDLTEANEDRCADLAIRQTRSFFEGLGISTRLRSYGVTVDQIDLVIEAMERHGHTRLSETGAVTLDMCRCILEDAMRQ